MAVELVQQEEGKHVYTGGGYTVQVNKDRKTWSASGPQGSLGKKFANREEAFNAVNAHSEQPAPTEGAPSGAESAPAEAEKPRKNPISVREKFVLQTIADNNGPMGLNQVIEVTKYAPEVVMGVVSALARRKMVSLNGVEGSSITDIGRQTLEQYDPELEPQKAAPKERTPVDPAERQRKLEEKWGPREEGIGPVPTEVEFETARVALKRAARDYQIMDLRMHPYSGIAKDKMKRANETLQLFTDRLNEALRRAGQPPVDVEGNEISEEQAEANRIKDGAEVKAAAAAAKSSATPSE